jgi:hypothetical protein
MAVVLRVNALLAMMALSLTTAAAGAGITKATLKIDRDSRTYYLFVPDSVGTEPAPLVITLHGSGRDGRPLVDLFRGASLRKSASSSPVRMRSIGAAGRRPTMAPPSCISSSKRSRRSTPSTAAASTCSAIPPARGSR